MQQAFGKGTRYSISGCFRYKEKEGGTLFGYNDLLQIALTKLPGMQAVDAKSDVDSLVNI